MSLLYQVVNTNSLFNRNGCRVYNSVTIQFVRWRKPIWAPMNPSKLFYFKKRQPEDPVESNKLRKLNSIYKTEMRSIRAYITEEEEAKIAARTSTAVTDLAAAEFQQVLDENNRWNEETRIIREGRQTRQEEETEEKRLEAILQIETKREKQKEIAVKQVLEETEKAKHFITNENLVEEIEKALRTRVDYNFAIDLEGRSYSEKADGSVEFEASIDKKVPWKNKTVPRRVFEQSAREVDAATIVPT